VAADPDELERSLAALRTYLEEVQARAALHEEELGDLDERRTEIEGKLALAHGEVGAVQDRLARQESELEQARREAARRELDDAVEQRNAAAEALAQQMLAVVSGLADQAERTRSLEQLAADLSKRGMRVEAPGQPAALLDAWERLQALVRTTLEGQLEDELVETAARSPLGQAIHDLPPHLQELARRRRRDEVRRRNAPTAAGDGDP
jgi:chromosome segregation ATPase